MHDEGLVWTEIPDDELTAFKPGGCTVEDTTQNRAGIPSLEHCVPCPSLHTRGIQVLNTYVLIKYIPELKEMTVGMGSEALAMGCLRQVKVNKEGEYSWTITF